MFKDDDPNRDQNDDKNVLTKLDEFKIDNLHDGEHFTSECGNWSVHHYGKKGGIIFLTLVEEHAAPSLEFDTKEALKKYITGNKAVHFKVLDIRLNSI